MPNDSKHLDQAARNQSLAQDLEQTVYVDWAVTTLFYAALHLVDAYFAKIGPGYHPHNHQQRDQSIARTAALSAISKHYWELKNRSEDARYQCVRFKASDVQSFRQNNFAPLKQQIHTLLGTPP